MSKLKVLPLFFFFFLLFTKVVQANTETAFGSIPSDPGAIANVVLEIGLALGGGVSLVLMILAAIKIISSRGNPDSLQEGKDQFTAAILGLLFIIFATLILQLIGRDILGIPGFSLNLHLIANAFTIPGINGNSQIQDPVGLKPGLNSLGAIIGAFIPSILGLAGMAAFIFLVMGGFKYLIARGDPKAIEDARKTISGAIIGLLVIVGLFLIISIIQTILGIKLTLLPSAYAANVAPTITPSVVPPTALPSGTIDLGDSFKFGAQGVSANFSSFGALISSIIKVILPLAGIIFFFMLLWGGLQFMLSLGDDKAKASARGIITSAVIGLLIILGSFLIITIIQTITGIPLLTPIAL